VSTHENEKALEVDQEAAPGAQAIVDDPQRKLPPELWIRVINLQPGDANTLVALTRQYPDFVDAILTQAAASAGNHTVSKAIEMLAANPVTEEAAPAAPAPQGRPMHYDYTPEGFKYDESVLTLEGGDIVGDHLKLIKMYPELRSKVLNGLGQAHPELFDEALERLHASEQTKAKGPTEKEITEQQQSGSGTSAQGNATDATETESQERAAKPKEEAKESAWITGAKRFNAAHPEEVAEFNRVTRDACVDSDGVLDPALVSDWQVAHGVQPDGRVGPATVDAAKRAAGIGHPIPITDEALADLE
jgi:hypothetical protein